MTRRIALAIFAVACAMLVMGGVTAYLVVRSALLGDLDEAIVERAASVLRAEGVDRAPPPHLPLTDRYLIKGGEGVTIARRDPDKAASRRPEVLERGFAVAADGSRSRSLTLRWTDPADRRTLTIVYSSSAERFDRLMADLAVTLAGVCLAGAGGVWLMARRLSRAVARPLREAAETIAEIDDRRLDRRIDLSKLPDDLRPLGQRVNEMLGRLESAFVDRRQFLINAAHELRSPVASLRTTLEVALERVPSDAAERRSLERALRGAVVLSRLVAALTEQLRAEQDGAAGAADDDSRANGPVEIAPIVRECVEMIEVIAAEKGIEIAASIEPACAVGPDKLAVHSVVTNLLSNAVQYTPPGGRVRVRVERAAGQCRVTVEDTGVGIAEVDKQRIFDPFYRADGARSPSAGTATAHLGLGLWIVRTHLRRTGGACEVDSAPGRGARFIVTWPAPPGPSEAEVTSRAAEFSREKTSSRRFVPAGESG